MCGIIAYVGPKNASEIVVEGLKKLEYRGYDSWGVAVHGNPSLFIEKRVGKISDFDGELPQGSMAIGHTRWATNGGVTKENAHPHTCCRGRIAVVHNGIIENFQELKDSLAHHDFRSETDTEIVSHLIEDNVAEGMMFGTAVRKALAGLEGRFAIVAISADSSEMVAARKGSPLVIGIGDGEYYVGSDVPAFIEHTRTAVYLEDGDVATISSGLGITDFSGNEVVRQPVEITWAVEQSGLDSHPYYMIKEILEQKKTLRLALRQDDDVILKVARMIDDASSVFFIGCGTAGKVCMVGSYVFSAVAKKQVSSVVGSEFPNYHDFLDEKTLLVCISQSGETADTLEAMEVARSKGGRIVSIVNVMGSSMMRMSDECILCNSGVEKAVCSTKVTTAQMAILTLLAYACAGRLDEGRAFLSVGSENVRDMLSLQYLEKLRGLAKVISAHESMYIIGRGSNYPIALEGAIKLQEVPYIHAEGFAGGELKHGPIALIESGTPCIALVADDNVRKEILINALEIRSRGGFIIGIAPKNNEIFDFWIPVPDVGLASPIVNIIPIQLLSYYAAVERGCDPDKPRNLAKSVTVK